MWSECSAGRSVLQRLRATGAGYVRSASCPSRFHPAITASNPISTSRASLCATRASGLANKRPAGGCVCRILAPLRGLHHRRDRSLFCWHDYYASVPRVHGTSRHYAGAHAFVAGRMDALLWGSYSACANKDGFELALLRTVGKLVMARNAGEKSVGL